MGRHYRVLAVVLVMIVVILTIIGVLNVEAIKAGVSTQFESYGLTALFVLTLIIESIPQYISGHMVLTVGFALGVDPLSLLMVVIMGGLGGSIIGFVVGRTIRENVMVDIFGAKRYKKVRHAMNKYGRWYVALAAVSPLPYVPMILSSLGMSYRNFIIFGLIPRVIGYIGLMLFYTGLF